jgi:quercetin dioxygenase-like cupin family protein
VGSVRRPAHAAELRREARDVALGATLVMALAGALSGPARAAPATAPAAASEAAGAAPSVADAPAAAVDEAARTVLQRVDLSGAAGMEVVTSLVELRPGERLPRHIHHGVETVYVLQGATIQAPGQAPRMLSSGSTAVHRRGVPHGGFTVVGDTPLKLLTTHVVDKGKPLYDAAPAEGRAESPRPESVPDAPR